MLLDSVILEESFTVQAKPKLFLGLIINVYTVSSALMIIYKLDFRFLTDLIMIDM